VTRRCRRSMAWSTDPDGSIASYAWTFTDGGTATAAARTLSRRPAPTTCR
jgi:hypothetical protein